MSRIRIILLALSLLWSAVHVAQQFAPMRAYATTHDDRQTPDTFSVMADMEPVDTAWITDCRERWRQMNE